MEERDEGFTSQSLANTHVDRSPVTLVGASSTPLAGIVNRDTSRINVVLSRGGQVVPDVVLASIRVGEGVGLTWLGVQWDSLALGTWIISSADGNILAEFVGNVNISDARCAEMGLFGSAQFKLSVGVAVQATDGLASGALGGWPLGLLITGGASIGAERVSGTARATSNTGVDQRDGRSARRVVWDLLNTDPVAKTQVRNLNWSVSRGEVGAVNGTAGEFRVDAIAGRGNVGGWRGCSGGGGSGGGRGGSGGSGS